VLTSGDREVIARFLVCHPREGDYLVGRLMTADPTGTTIALYYDGELIACCKPGMLVAASEGLTEVATRVRDDVVSTARSFGAVASFTRRLPEPVAAADSTAA